MLMKPWPRVAPVLFLALFPLGLFEKSVRLPATDEPSRPECAGWNIRVKTRPEGMKDFTLLENRWVIDRTNA